MKSRSRRVVGVLAVLWSIAIAGVGLHRRSERATCARNIEALDSAAYAWMNDN